MIWYFLWPVFSDSSPTFTWIFPLVPVFHNCSISFLLQKILLKASLCHTWALQLFYFKFSQGPNWWMPPDLLLSFCTHPQIGNQFSVLVLFQEWPAELFLRDPSIWGPWSVQFLSLPAHPAVRNPFAYSLLPPSELRIQCEGGLL